MILHVVCCAIRPDVGAADIADVFGALNALVGTIDGLQSFEGGVNIDLEQKSAEYTHGFVMRFDSQDAVEKYATHPAHVAAGQALVALCDGGADGITVFDLVI